MSSSHGEIHRIMKRVEQECKALSIACEFYSDKIRINGTHLQTCHEAMAYVSGYIAGKRRAQ